VKPAGKLDRIRERNMIDTMTSKPLTIYIGEGGYSHLIVPETQLEQVKALFDANQVLCWVDEELLSVDGEPEVGFISFSLKADLALAQRLLDSIP
jgi:hypothetical protein